MRRILISIALLLLAVIGGTGLWGVFIPVGHKAASQVTLTAPPESVYAVIRDIKALPSWWKEVSAVEPVHRNDDWERWQETTDGMAMTLIVSEEVPDQRLVTTIDTAGHPPFGGTWTYTTKLAPGGGTTLVITEDGTVSNPFFRVMMRLSGTHTTLDSYLTALGKRFGQHVTPAHVVP